MMVSSFFTLLQSPVRFDGSQFRVIDKKSESFAKKLLGIAGITFYKIAKNFRCHHILWRQE